MKPSRPALRYAKAAMQYSQIRKSEKAVASDMISILKILTKKKSLTTFLENPVLPLAVKKATLFKIFSGCKDETIRLIELLSANNRLSLLGDVAESYLELYEKLSGNVIATVVTAVSLTPNMEAKVLEKARSITDKNVTLLNTIDPNIIGGFILQIGDLQYDASIASQLKTLKRELTTSNTI